MTAKEKISLAITKLLLSSNPVAPFFSSCIMQIDISESNCKTMATDGKKIIYNKAFVESITDTELMGVLVHEVWHVLLLHHTRSGGRDKELWNVAADLAINPICIEQNLVLPKGALFAGKEPFASLPLGLTAEEYYKLLQDPKNGIPQKPVDINVGSAPSQNKNEKEEEDKEDPEDEDTQEDEGSESDSDWEQEDESSESDSDSQYEESDEDSDDDLEPKELIEQPVILVGNESSSIYICPQTFGEVFYPGKSTQEEIKESETAVELMKEMAMQTASMRGTVPASLTRLIKDKKSKIDWRSLLQDYLLRFSKSETVWTKPDKRFYPEYHLPSLGGKEMGGVVFLIDTSGSIDHKLLNAFASEVNDFRSQHKKQTTVLWHDTVVNKTELLEPDDVWTPKAVGGGGTSHVDAINKALDSDPDLIVSLTDCYSEYPNDPGVDVLFLRYGKGSPPAWGITIDMEL